MVLNKQKMVRLATRPLQEFLRKAQRELKISGSEITVALVSDAEIARWNEAYRKKSGPTDVLSFPATSGAALPNGSRRSRAQSVASAGSIRNRSPLATGHSPLATGHSPLFLGDIAIAPETAQRYAAKNGRTLHDELRILILHGALHLLGYDHECDSGQMERVERKLRRKLGLA